MTTPPAHKSNVEERPSSSSSVVREHTKDHLKLLQQVAEDGFGIDIAPTQIPPDDQHQQQQLAIEPIQSIWGNRVTRIVGKQRRREGENGHKEEEKNDTNTLFFLKKPVSYHSDASTDCACRFATAASQSKKLALCSPSELNLGGGVDILGFVKPSSPPVDPSSSSLAYVYKVPNNVVLHTESRGAEKRPLRFVCTKMIEGSLDLQKCQREGHLSRHGVRLHMARSLAVLHSFNPVVHAAAERQLSTAPLSTQILSSTALSFDEQNPRFRPQDNDEDGVAAGVEEFLLASMDHNIPFLGGTRQRLQRPIQRLKNGDCPHLIASFCQDGVDDTTTCSSSCTTPQQQREDPQEQIRRVLANLENIAESNIADRIDALPTFPVTCDLQSKNFVHTFANDHSLSGEEQPSTAISGGTTTIINTEILVKHSRLFDLLYLLVLDDGCSGCAELLVDSGRWLVEFASAVGVYAAHYNPSAVLSPFITEESRSPPESSPSLFTPDEIELFPFVVEMKIAQIAVINVPEHAPDARKCLHLLSQFDDEIRNALRSVLRDVSRGVPRSPHLFDWHPTQQQREEDGTTTTTLSEVSSSRGLSFDNMCLDRILQGRRPRSSRCAAIDLDAVLQRPKKAIIYFNGTYAPYHQGHMEAAAQAAATIEAADPSVEVVGIAISPCKQSYAKKKLTRKQESQAADVFTDVNRIALIDLCLHGSATSTLHHQPLGDDKNDQLEEKHIEDPVTFLSRGPLDTTCYNAFVDTNECLFHEASDAKRYVSIVERFKKTVAHANDVINKQRSVLGGGDTALQPVVCFASGDDIIEHVAKYTTQMVEEHDEWKDIVRAIVISRRCVENGDTTSQTSPSSAGSLDKQQEWRRKFNSRFLPPATASTAADARPPASIPGLTIVPSYLSAPSALSISSTAVREAVRTKDWSRVKQLLGCGATAWWIALKDQ